MEDSFKDWKGMVKVTVYDGDMDSGKVKEVVEFHNVITTDGKTLLVSALGGVNSKILFMGVGTSTTAENASQHQLVSEYARKAITTRDPGSAGQYITRCYLSPNDGNGTIEELGWFAGDSATTTLNSGVMVARVLYHHVKTNTESLLIERTDTLP